MEPLGRRHYLELSDGRQMWDDDKRIERIDGVPRRAGDTVHVYIRTNGNPSLWGMTAVVIQPPRDLLAEVEKAISDEGFKGVARESGRRLGYLLPTGQWVSKDSDPHGVPQHAPGAKLDAEKPRVGLVMDGFALALLEVAKVGTYGAKKYSDNGWMAVKDGEARYKDAMLRHALQAGSEECDQGSGLLHDAQVAWNALAKLELKLRGTL